jgi:hypothetical protein
MCKHLGYARKDRGIYKNSSGLTEETRQKYKNTRFLLCICENKKIILDLINLKI